MDCLFLSRKRKLKTFVERCGLRFVAYEHVMTQNM